MRETKTVAGLRIEAGDRNAEIGVIIALALWLAMVVIAARARG